MSQPLPLPREAYEGTGGWRDGRIGQAYDLLAEVLKEREGGNVHRNKLLLDIEALDGEPLG